MKIVDKLRMSVNRRSDHVILRSELNKFGSKSQLSEAINNLIDDGILMRVGRPGVFVKVKKNSIGKCELLTNDFDKILKEFLNKINVNPASIETTWRNDQYECIVDLKASRKATEFHLGDNIVIYFQMKHSRPEACLSIPKDVEKLPKKNVSEFVKNFAECHHIKSKHSKVDLWAEAVTRAAGDTVHLDTTGRLLNCLYKEKLIDGKQMARLLTNHILELKSNIESTDKKAKDRSKTLSKFSQWIEHQH